MTEGKRPTLADILNIPKDHDFRIGGELIPLELSFDELDVLAKDRGCRTNWARWEQTDALMLNHTLTHSVCPVFKIENADGSVTPHIEVGFMDSLKRIFVGE